jgi:hexosaminidase
MTGGAMLGRRGRVAAWLVWALIVTSCGEPAADRVVEERMDTTTMGTLIPRPVSATATGQTFTLAAATVIYVEGGAPELAWIGRYLAGILRPATGYAFAVRTAQGAPDPGNLYLTTAGGDASLGEEGYALTIAPDGVTLAAPRPAGLFWGVQTLRQLLPPAIERDTVQPGPWPLPTGTIRDRPRFAWRGAMLDVARHFFSVDDVERFVDELAYYKMNRLHLHLTDDQGWRIAIEAWPRLATHGGSTAVGGGPGGYYTQAEYAEIIAYAQQRYVTVVPEIDMPGHSHAALTSYAALNCDGQAPPPYTGTDVGFSTLCVDEAITYEFVDDVVGEITALTPGPYLHIGGDEAAATPAAEYRRFVARVQAIVAAHGKEMIGWEEIARADLAPGAIVQHWHSDLAARAVQQGAKVILSPASRAYLDMKYTADTPLGLTWAGLLDVQEAYDWEPVEQVEGVPEAAILGVEAPLWSETLQTLADVEFMAFPRLPGYAEIGWSPAAGRDWSEYRARLAAHGPRLVALGVNFYRSALVAWPP